MCAFAVFAEADCLGDDCEQPIEEFTDGGPRTRMVPLDEGYYAFSVFESPCYFSQT